jgi:hypothetical protein
VRIEITQELEPDDDALEVPWAGPADPSWRYWDLKLFPEKIAELPECRAFPALRACLAKINSPSSTVRTAKCDVWRTTDLAKDERMDFNLPYKTGSYLDVIFDDVELRKERDACVRFAENLRSRLSALRAQAQMEIILRRCLFHPEEAWGYALTFFVHAYGSTPAEAVAEWRRAMEALGEALAKTRSAPP